MKFEGNWDVFSMSVDTKLSWKNTHTYKTQTWTETTDTLKLDPVDYRRKVHRCTVADVLRLVSLPDGTVLNELETLTAIQGRFCTDQQGRWQDRAGQVDHADRRGAPAESEGMR